MIAYEICNGKKGLGIDAMLAANLSHRSVAKTEGDVKPADHKDEKIVILNHVAQPARG